MFFLIIFVAALVRIRGRTGIAVTYEYKWHKDIDINHITLRVMYRGHHLYFRFLKTSLSVSHPLTFCVQIWVPYNSYQAFIHLMNLRLCTLIH